MFLRMPKEGNMMENARNDAVLEVLREQGFEIGESVIHNEQVRVWIRSKHDSALVEIGRDLLELAAGRLTLADIGRREG
jgi:hypothetical protein